MSHQISIEDLATTRPHTVRILIAQIRSTDSEWHQREGLYYYRELSKIPDRLRQLLLQAVNYKARLIVLPELAVPAECVPLLRDWSQRENAIVVAGSHYSQHPDGCRNQCPVIVNGELFVTDKMNPAHMEISPIGGQGVLPGLEIKVFRNTVAGNFAVLICADYLDGLMTETVINSIEDGIDLLCVPAFQANSDRYHRQMSLDCLNSEHGLYIAYANMLCGDKGDGKSALFGLMEHQYLDKLRQDKLKTDSLNEKIFDFEQKYDYGIFELDLKHKRPYLGHTHKTHVNIKVVKVDRISDERAVIVTATMNALSLDYFVKTNASIMRIDSKIRDAIGKTIVSADKFIDAFVKRLLYVGINSLDQLEQALSRDESLVTDCAIGWFKHPRGQRSPLIPSGVSISFLCVVLILKEKNGVNRLLDFWKELKFDPTADAQEITDVMVDIYKAANASTKAS